MKKRVLLGLSGGLDSTYAAKVLADEGYSVEGAVLKMHGYTETEAARVSAKELGIPLHEIDCTDAFEKTVVENFLDEYTGGRTPNPCIICNREVKFRFLYEYAMKNGFDKIATGHYARVVKLGSGAETRYAVARASDPSKDQTYMLWRLSQEQLAHLVFPLSEMKKEDVRALSRNIGLSAAQRRDSQEICFIPDADHVSFIEKHRPAAGSGSFKDENGRVIGEHGGFYKYTVGQRKGLGISLGQRAFVREIDPFTNTVVVGCEPKKSSTVHISEMVFSGLAAPLGETCCVSAFVKLRYRAKPVRAVANISPDGSAVLHLDEPQDSVTPGQSAVLYDGDTVLAGGFIRLAE
ncbi:MAG: tRNA 2-thiouridine(34) synthase MnmA [Clostridia bacterium]|nr:tRNA 2-thiouridine(34) synthase MnmA [Clostridia bacterium]